MDLISCRRCGMGGLGSDAACVRCGYAPITSAREPAPGLGPFAQAVVICSVFAVVLCGMVVFAARQDGIDASAQASARAAAAAEREADADREAAEAALRATPTPRPRPAPDAGGPDTYTVQHGDSLFSVAADLGVSANELVYWNKDTYPTLQSTPALEAGWVLRTAGPPLPTPMLRPTPAAPEPTPEPQVAGPAAPGIGAVGPEAFPASASVTVTYYPVTGATPSQLFESMEANGPWSEWIGERADASVQTNPSFNFGFDAAGPAGCTVVLTGAVPVTATYEVALPSWTPPAGVAQATIDWWVANVADMAAHEGRHIEIYESYFTQMNEVIRTGTCDTVEAEVARLAAEAARANCEFDLEEYGYAYGMTLADCATDQSSD